MLQKRPDWQTEWAEMTEHGSPLPNEMIVLSSMGSDLTFCFVPVVDKEDSKKVTRMIVAPVITDTIATLPRLGTPYLFDEKTIDKNSVARSFIGLDIVKAWRDKGLEFNAKVTPRETAKVGTRDVWYWNTMGLQILYQTTGVGGDPNFVTARQVQTYVANYRVVERFVYQYGEGRGIFMEPPRYNDFWETFEIDIYTRKKLTIADCGVEMYGYTNMLREYIWNELPWEYRNYMISQSRITMNYHYQWGNSYDDGIYSDLYPPSTGAGGSGSHQPPSQTSICRMCDCGKADCYCGSPEMCIVPYISPVVKVPSGLLNVGASYTISVETGQDAPPPTEKILGVEFIINDGERDWYFDRKNGVSAMSYVARAPGIFRFKALIYTEDSTASSYETEYTDPVTQVFPSMNVVMGEFNADMTALWNTSLGAADQWSTYEYAAIMKLDTTEDGEDMWRFLSYPSDSYDYNLSSFPAPFPPAGHPDNEDYYGNPIDGGYWTVGICHTHPAWYYATSPRPVGPSTKDPAPGNGIPAWVLDYYPESIPGGKSGVNNGTRATQFKFYSYGGNRREN